MIVKIGLLGSERHFIVLDSECISHILNALIIKLPNLDLPEPFFLKLTL